MTRRTFERAPYISVKRKHRWVVCGLHAHHDAIEKCGDCFITKAIGGWYDSYGDWHTGPMPRCGE